jgi:hypothetical protein
MDDIDPEVLRPADRLFGVGHCVVVDETDRGAIRQAEADFFLAA